MEKRKGIILSNERERYVETNINYMYRDEDGEKVPFIHLYGRYKGKNKIRYEFWPPKRATLFEIGDIIYPFNNKEEKYYVFNNADGKLLCLRFIPIRHYNNSVKKYKKVRNYVDGKMYFAKCDEVIELDIDEFYIYECSLLYEDVRCIRRKVNSYIKKKKRIEKAERGKKYNFGEILSLQNSKNNFIFVFYIDDNAYTCDSESLTFFCGLSKILPEQIYGTYDSLSIDDKEILIEKLNKYIQSNKYVDKDIKEQINKLILKNKSE